MTLGRLLGIGGLLVAAWVALMGGEYSTFDWWRLQSAHETEQTAIEQLTVEVDSLRTYLDLLLNDPATQERVAREQFGMIRDGEILYRLVPERRSRETGSGTREPD